MTQSVKNLLTRLGVYKPLRRAYLPLRNIMFRKVLLPYRTQRFYRQFAQSGSLCFDIGANVGLRTRALRALGAIVVAVEPQRRCCDILRQEFLTDQNVIIEPFALGSEQGVGRLGLVEGASPLASLAENWRKQGPFAHLFSGKTEAVTITTLDALIARHGMPGFIKIDVEGYEAEVLRGLHRAPTYLSFEYVAQLLNNAEQCISLLDALGFTRYNYSSGDTMRWRFSEWMSGKELLSLLGSTTDNGSEWGDIYAHHTSA